MAEPDSSIDVVADPANPKTHISIGTLQHRLPGGQGRRRPAPIFCSFDPTAPRFVALNFDTPARMQADGHVLRINSLGLTDTAGNQLVERFFVPFPSINQPPSSDFVAQINTDGISASGPQQYIPLNEIAAVQRRRGRGARNRR